jgi:hypothetical protein
MANGVRANYGPSQMETLGPRHRVHADQVLDSLRCATVCDAVAEDQRQNRSPARLIVALSVAASLAVFLVYTSIRRRASDRARSAIDMGKWKFLGSWTVRSFRRCTRFTGDEVPFEVPRKEGPRRSATPQVSDQCPTE